MLGASIPVITEFPDHTIVLLVQLWLALIILETLQRHLGSKAIVRAESSTARAAMTECRPGIFFRLQADGILEVAADAAASEIDDHSGGGR